MEDKGGTFVCWGFSVASSFHPLVTETKNPEDRGDQTEDHRLFCLGQLPSTCCHFK